MTYNLETFKPVPTKYEAPVVKKQKVFLTVSGDKFSFSYKAREILHYNRVKVMYDDQGTYAFVGCVDGPLRLRFCSKLLYEHIQKRWGWSFPRNCRWFPVEEDKQNCALFFNLRDSQKEKI